MYTCFEGRTVLVTGGGSGIGGAIALELARHNASIAVADRDGAGAGEVAAGIAANGGRALAVEADVADPAGAASMVENTLGEFGALHYAVNCAGIGGELVSTAGRPDESWRSTLSVNLDGVHYSMKHEIPAILSAGGGAIVNIACVYSSVGLEGNAAYTASKSGVAGLTRAAALEYASRGIRINTLSPGPVRTPLTDENPEMMALMCRDLPTGRAGLPREIAPIAVFLLSDKASLLVGAEIMADSGKAVK